MFVLGYFVLWILTSGIIYHFEKDEGTAFIMGMMWPVILPVCIVWGGMVLVSKVLDKVLK